MIRYAVLCASLLLAHASFAADPELDPELTALTGVYRGFTFTSESPAGLSEYEVTLDARFFVSRTALGASVAESRVPLDQFKRLTKEDLERDGMYHESTFGFRGPGGYPALIFHRAPRANVDLSDTDFGLIVLPEPAAHVNGPTALLTPAQLSVVDCEDLLTTLEREFLGEISGPMPRL